MTASLLDLAGRDTRLHRADRAGREMAGPCPMCGGEDRFRVRGDRWYCRGCSPRWRDVIDYLRERDGIGYRAACHALGVEPGQPLPRPQAVQREHVEREPSPEWRAAGAELVARAARALWTPAGGAALRHLRERGLRDETIRTWGLGYSSAEWIAGLWVPAPCVVIPWWIGGALWQVKVRMLQPRAGGAKYLPVTWCDAGKRERLPAGQAHLFGADTLAGRASGVLVEGEFDCVLLAQEAGDLVGVATLGSCATSLPARAARYLLPLRRVLLAYDADEEGRRGARRQQTRFTSFERIEVPTGKDVTEYHLAGGSVGEWVRHHVEVTP